MNLPEPQTLIKHDKSSPLEHQTLVNHDKSNLPEPESSIYLSNPAQIQLRSTDPHMKFRPSSKQFMPTSCQLRVGQYARTISNDSPAPHSYDPTMGRRQRRQPINYSSSSAFSSLSPHSSYYYDAAAPAAVFVCLFFFVFLFSFCFFLLFVVDFF